MITSPQNDRIKHIKALQTRSKNRRAAGQFVVEGIRLAEEAVKADWPIVSGIYTEGLAERGQTLIDELAAKGIDMQLVAEHVMRAASDTEAPQGILLVLELTPQLLPETLDFILILDQIRDPGNMGTLLRSAAAAGAQAVILPPDTVDVFSPKVVRAGMGAHFHLPLITQSYEQLHAMIEQHQCQLFIAEAEGEKTLYQASFAPPTALAIGGETNGVSAALRALPHIALSIPMPGHAESLNAGVAGSVMLFEVVRQRT